MLCWVIYKLYTVYVAVHMMLLKCKHSLKLAIPTILTKLADV